MLTDSHCRVSHILLTTVRPLRLKTTLTSFFFCLLSELAEYAKVLSECKNCYQQYSLAHSGYNSLVRYRCV